MSQSIMILYQIMETSSGKIFLVEEKNQNTITKYYAFQFLYNQIKQQLGLEIKILEKSKHKNLFRNHQKLILPGQQIEYELNLFEYYEGSQFLDNKVFEYGKIKKSFDLREIKQYLKNLLVALYELHSNQIPGRIFSIYNILVVQPSERLVLMDFGFGPDIQQDKLDILAPPEYLEEIINKNQKKNDFFDLKFDSWLIGAFLYHLIKFKPINQVEVGQNNFERYKYDRKEQFYDYLKQIQFIPCVTTRYKENLLSFVQELLTCDPKKRLSFYQIYQHKYIQDLNLEGRQQYIEFYKRCEQIQDFQNANLGTEGWSIDQSLNPPEQKLQKFPIKPEMIYSQSKFLLQESNNQSNFPPQEQPKKKIQFISTITIKNSPDYLSIIMSKPQFQNSSFDNYWLQIQLDCLRCYILETTTDRILPILSKYKHPFDQIFQYIVKKMHLLILREINNYLNSDFYQNKPDKNWQIFKNQHEKDLLQSHQMNSHMSELLEELRIFQQNCQIEGSKLPEIIKQSLTDDRCQNYNMILNSFEFYLNGYAEALQILMEFINSQIVNNPQQSDELVQFRKLIYFCIDINSSFKPQQFQEQFKELRQSNPQVQPKDIINYLGQTK